MSRKMQTMGDLRKKGAGAADDDSDEEGASPARGGGGGGGRPNNLYVGSGQAVIGPGGGRGAGAGAPAKGLVDSIMGQQGVGDGASRGQVVIKFWKNGLTVDDGPLRALDDPAQKEFLDSINKGIVPMELRERHRALQAQGGLDVSVEDHRTEDFVEPAYRAFSGSGANLGRAAPPAAAVVAKGSGKAAVVDDTKPTTTIQVKLVNGKREKIVLNLTHTVADLQGAVAALGATGGKPFSLSAGFPPKALADPDLTVEAAGLKNASVTQVVA